MGENGKKSENEEESGWHFNSRPDPAEQDLENARRKEKILMAACIISVVANILTTWLAKRYFVYPTLTLAVTWIVGEIILSDDPLISIKHLMIFIVTLTFSLLNGITGNIIRAHYGF